MGLGTLLPDDVQDYQQAVSQVAQTSLRSIIGKSELDDLLSNRSAEGELQASEKLAAAAAAIADTPAALQLRLLETVVQVASEKNSMLILPFPVELLRFLDAATPPTPNPAPHPHSAG